MSMLLNSLGNASARLIIHDYMSGFPTANQVVRSFVAWAGQSAGMGNTGIPLHLLQQQEQLLRYCV